MHGKHQILRRMNRASNIAAVDAVAWPAPSKRPGQSAGIGIVTLTISRQAGEAIVTARGQLDVETVLSAMRMPGFGTMPHSIWDLRAASLSALDHEDLVDIAGRFANTDDTRHTLAAAIIVGDIQARLLAQLFGEISRHRMGRTIPLYIASDFTDARQWLNDAPALNKA